MRLESVKHEEAKRGFVLLPRRWVVERDFAWVIALSALGEGLREAAHHFGRGCTSSPSLASFLQQAAGILSVGS
jgi:transposase